MGSYFAEIRQVAADVADLYQRLTKEDTVVLVEISFLDEKGQYIQARIPACSRRAPKNWTEIAYTGVVRKPSKAIDDWENWYYPRLAVANSAAAVDVKVDGQVVVEVDYTNGRVLGKSCLVVVREKDHLPDSGNLYGYTIPYPFVRFGQQRWGGCIKVSFTSENAEVLNDFCVALDELVAKGFI